MTQKEFYNSTAWKWFSKYIKLKYMNNDGLIQCATSGKWYTWGDRKLQAGHYIKSTHRSTAFDERNVLPQCYHDNRYYSGKPDIMALKIDEIFGAGTCEELRIKSKFPFKLDKLTMKFISDEYREKAKALAKEKGVKL